ncbi:MAG: GNAT family N-acetyltransferase [Lachnospiraceae bacterium]|nr:GNAT family N-acetyltransferase [Tyzzerella sp.]MBQ3165266.1 GNAT family N-acetyltransferase [Lachnospiraceae bacterium]
MITPIIETERMILRPLTVADAEDIYERWTTDERVARYVRWSVHTSVDLTIEWLKMVEQVLDSDQEYQWGFTLKDSGYLFGGGGMHYDKEENAWEIGYNLMYDYWNQGYATEATKAMLEFGINTLKQKEFVAWHAVDNPASGAVMRKCGFEYEKNEVHTKFDGVTSFDTRKHRLVVSKMCNDKK